MMGTLAALLAGKKIPTYGDNYSADVEGDIENVNNVLKITRMRVKYHLKIHPEKVAEAQDAFSSYLQFCPAAQSIGGCIEIKDDLVMEYIELKIR
ncbi:MAG: OsmC family protein [Deltaproteobacteria bacterium]|nr:OsmC family protein [Deltaproteobacteria bacterium]